MINKKLRYLFILPALVFSSHYVIAQEATKETTVTTAAPENPTGWDRLLRAYETRKQLPQGRLGGAQVVEDSPEDLALMRAFTDANTELLQVAHEVLKSPPHRPQQDYSEEGINSIYAFHTTVRDISRIMMQRGRVQAADGDLSGALQTDLDIVALGVGVQRGGVVIDSLIGNALESSGRANLRRNLPRFDATLAREAAARLIALDAAHLSYADTVRSEKALNLALLKKTLNSTDWKSFRAGVDEEIEFPDTGFTKVEIDLVRATTDEDIINDVAGVIDAAIERAAQPYDNTLTPLKAPVNAASRIFAHTYLRSVQPDGRINFERNRNSNRMLAVAFALQSYHADNREYPTSLGQLVPQYLDTIPTDPFEKNAPLRYRHTPDGYVLYSVGPDGMDNNGEPTLVETESKAVMSPDNNSHLHIK
ncbi:MAG TPA: hypothetical protein VF719_12770, partial [Abditibacteriaceae bacterium]